MLRSVFALQLVVNAVGSFALGCCFWCHKVGVSKLKLGVKEVLWTVPLYPDTVDLEKTKAD